MWELPTLCSNTDSKQVSGRKKDAQLIEAPVFFREQRYVTETSWPLAWLGPPEIYILGSKNTRVLQWAVYGPFGALVWCFCLGFKLFRIISGLRGKAVERFAVLKLPPAPDVCQGVHLVSILLLLLLLLLILLLLQALQFSAALCLDRRSYFGT